MIWSRQYRDRLDLHHDDGVFVATVIITWHIFDLSGRPGRQKPQDHKKRKLFTIVMADGSEKKTRSAILAIEWVEKQLQKRKGIQHVDDAEMGATEDSCESASEGC